VGVELDEEKMRYLAFFGFVGGGGGV